MIAKKHVFVKKNRGRQRKKAGLGPGDGEAGDRGLESREERVRNGRFETPAQRRLDGQLQAGFGFLFGLSLRAGANQVGEKGGEVGLTPVVIEHAVYLVGCGVDRELIPDVRFPFLREQGPVDEGVALAVEVPFISEVSKTWKNVVRGRARPSLHIPSLEVGVC